MSKFQVHALEFNINAWFYLPYVVQERVLVKSNACTVNLDLTDLKTKNSPAYSYLIYCRYEQTGH